MYYLLCIGSATLKKLAVNHNDIGDSGMQVLLEELQHNSVLYKLWIDHCGLSAKGSITITVSLISYIAIVNCVYN